MIKVYLASPYSSGIPAHYSQRYIPTFLGERYHAAVSACAWLANEGHIVHSPIVHWHVVAKQHKLRKDHEFWKDQNDAMLEWCDAVYVLMLKGWEKSIGIKEEVIKARVLHKFVWFMKLNDAGHRQLNKVKKYKLTREPIQDE